MICGPASGLAGFVLTSEVHRQLFSRKWYTHELGVGRLAFSRIKSKLSMELPGLSIIGRHPAGQSTDLFYFDLSIVELLYQVGA